MWYWISYAIFGVIAGALAKWIMPGDNEPQGCIMTMILGVVGAMLGGWIGKSVMNFSYDNWSISGFFWGVGGSILVLLIYGAIFGRKK